MPALAANELQFAGLATGLTALAAHLTQDGASAGVTDPVVVAWLVDQRREVAARVARFDELVPQVRGALAAAGVPAVPVKGAELAASATPVWSLPSARPMADVDLVVPRRYRAQAAATMVTNGLRPAGSTSFEDVFLAWGDGSVGRTDGESALHNGRVELHPDWTEFLHGYVARGFDVEMHAVADPELEGGFRLDHAELTTHVVGHLSSTVVRAEVRAVNVVDVWWCHQAGVDWDRVAMYMSDVDPRLSAPGLWLAHAVVPGVVPVRLLAREFDRLPKAARQQLDGIAPEEVFRDPATRTTARWRLAFASGRERGAILDQMAFPSGARSVRSLATRATRLRVRARA